MGIPPPRHQPGNPLARLTLPKPPKKHPYGPWTSAGANPPGRNEALFVAGFGAVIRSSDRRDIQVQVKLVPFDPRFRWDDEGAPLETRLDQHRAWWETIPAGFLPYMHAGQVWKDGHLVADPEHTTTVFHDVRVAPETVQPLWDFKHLVLGGGGCVMLVPPVFRMAGPAPPGRKWPAKRAGGLLLRVRLPGTRDALLIPPVVVARFYAAPSSKLTRALLTGYQKSVSIGSSDQRGSLRHLTELYTPLRTLVLPDGTYRTQLRMQTEDVDALDVGRLAFDEAWRRRALRVGALLHRLEEQRQVGVLHIDFPFIDTTTLKVRGTWIEEEVLGTLVRHFLVFQILECLGPWPFTKFTWGRDNDGRETKGGGLSEGGGGGGGDDPRSPGPGRPREGDGERVWAQPAGSLLRGLVQTTLPPRTFIDLPAEKEDKTDPSTEGGWPEPGEEGGDDVTPGPDTSGATPHSRLNVRRRLPRAPGEKLSEEEPAEEPPLLEPDLALFCAAVEHAAHEHDWTVVWRHPDFEVGGGWVDGPEPIEFPLLDEEFRRPAWCYLERRPEELRYVHRHALIAEMGAGTRFAYLVDAERRPNEEIAALVVASEHGRRLHYTTLERLLKRAVERASKGKGPWDQGGPDFRGYYKAVSHGHRPQIGDGQEEFIARFAARLAKHVAAALAIPPERNAKDRRTDQATGSDGDSGAEDGPTPM